MLALAMTSIIAHGEMNKNYRSTQRNTLRKKSNRRRNFIRNRISNRKRFDPYNTPKATSLEKGETIQIAMQQSRPLRIPRLMFITDSVIVDLIYPDTTLVKNNVGSSFVSWRYRMNSVWDPDPALGSGAVPGHTFWTGAYNSYRVLAISYSAQLMNLEGSPVDIVAVPSNTDLGLNYPSTNELFGNPYATVSALSAKGGMDRAALKGYIDLGHYYGNSTQYLGNDAFGSGVSTNPGTVLYLNFGGVSATNFTTSNGLDYRINLTYTVLYTQRKIVTT
jgi:hypothetical protein